MFSNFRLRILGYLVVLWLGLSACAIINPFIVPTIDVPLRPTLAICPDYPHIGGKVVDGEDGGKYVVLTLEDALRLRNWAHAYLVCSQENQVELEGYIEKLVNRIKAVGAGSAE